MGVKPEWTTGKELGPRYEPTQLLRDEEHVATVWGFGGASELRAQEMARKLNAHDDLLSACKEALHVLTPAQKAPMDGLDRHRMWLRQAIAGATGEARP